MSLAGVIGVPATEHGRWSAFRACLTDLEKPPGWVVKECHGASEPRNRHEITVWALERGAEWIFWLDDDLLFYPTVLLKTLARQQPVVIGLSLFRRPTDGQFHPIWSHAGPNDGPLWEQVRTIRPGPNGLMRIGAGSNGGLLVHRSVFEAIGQPYWRKHPDDPFETSTDIDFCWRAQRAGFTVWGDPSVTYGHIAHLAVWPYQQAGQWHTVIARGFEPALVVPWKDDDERLSGQLSHQAAAVEQPAAAAECDRSEADLLLVR